MSLTASSGAVAMAPAQRLEMLFDELAELVGQRTRLMVASWRSWPRSDQTRRDRRGGGRGSDAHYAELARNASVHQLRTAIKLEPPPEPEPDSESEPEPPPELTAPIPAVAPCHGSSGERADWWWYQPFEPRTPPTTN